VRHVAHVDEDTFIGVLVKKSERKDQGFSAGARGEKLAQIAGARLSRRGRGGRGPTVLLMFSYRSMLPSSLHCKQ
jgi:hypothetical protein